MKTGIIKNNLDISISPKEDFYLFANGGWMKENPLKPEFSSYGTFDVLRENSRKQLQELILNLSEDPESKIKDTISQKICDLYAMGMNEKRLNEEGCKPLKPTLELIKDITKEKLTDQISRLHLGIDSAFFSSGVGPHPADSNLNILHIGETGLGLGDRDYYIEDNETNKKILAAYEKYVKRLMELIGKNNEEQERIWQNVIIIEREIAKHKMTREQRRDPLMHFNITSIEDLKKYYSFIDWDLYFKNLQISPKEVNISSVGFLKFMNEYLPQLDIEKIKDYLIFSLTSGATSLLSDDFIDADFELYGRVMSGQKEKKPRWKRAMSLPNSMFGEAVGELYVKKYFPPENKQYMLRLVENLRSSLKKHIEKASWMSELTKDRALEKLKDMKVKIGYPDKWKDYSELHIDSSLSYLENVQKASIWFAKDNYAKLNKPVDKTEWHMTPQTVNAYYSPVSNEICFPAGILQPPYFDLNADDANNYGAIGAIIGHEMTHGFDDQGRQYDKNGNLDNWWTEEDTAKFNKRAEILEKQFNKIEVAPDTFANGKFTLGENIADQGGLRVALTAYKDYCPESRDIDGFSPLQRFYISYANIWASNITSEEILVRTKSDPHSLAKYRVNATLKNIDEFYEAFNITEGDKMFLPKNERIIIW